MGWWQIDSVEYGQIDWEVKRPGRTLVNALPGEDSSKAMYNGDGPADVMGSAVDEIIQLYMDAWGRPPCKDELLAVFNFCVNPLYDEDGEWVGEPEE